MTKKIIYILGIWMMATLVIRPFWVYGQGSSYSGDDKDVNFSAARLFSKIVESTGLNPAANWAESFGATKEDDIGQNLYLTVYKKIRLEPARSTSEKVAGKYGLPEGDLNRILNGDYAMLMDKKPGLSQADVQRKVVEIQQQYSREKDIAQLEAEIKAEVEPNEIFANGSVADSGFDLINDLQIIENLLFLKADPTDIGGTYTGGNAGGKGSVTATVPGANGNTADTEVKPAVQSTTGSNESTDGAAEESSTGTNANNNVSTNSASGVSTDSVSPQVNADSGLDNVNSCQTDPKLTEALQQFTEAVAMNPLLQDGAVGQNSTDGTGTNTTTTGSSTNNTEEQTTGSAGAATEAGSTLAGGTNADFLPLEPDSTPAAVAAPADKWLKDKYCAGSFCIYVKEIKKLATTSYKTSDNCIACHAEHIRDTLKKVINHSLVPAKAPGNLGESAECKKAMATAFGSISMNFYAIAMPVKTPINDDLVYGSNIEDDWKNYCNTVVFPFTCRNNPPKMSTAQSYTPPEYLGESAAEKELVTAPDGISQNEINERIEATKTSYVIQGQEETMKSKVSADTDKSIGFYNPLQSELELMNYHFRTIQNVLHSLHEKVESIPGSQACVTLKNKKECE